MTPTSRPSWETSLNHLLNQLSRKAELNRCDLQRPRIAVVCVGQELRGDDAAGLAVARGLGPQIAGQEHILLVEAGPVPENFTGPLRRFSPGLVLFVDAAQMNEPPGTVRLVDWREASGISAVTHSMPIYVLAGYLASELGCVVALLGIQPGGNELAQRLSPPVQRAVQEVIAGLAACLIPSGS